MLDAVLLNRMVAGSKAIARCVERVADPSAAVQAKAIEFVTAFPDGQLIEEALSLITDTDVSLHAQWFQKVTRERDADEIRTGFAAGSRLRRRFACAAACTQNGREILELAARNDDPAVRDAAEARLEILDVGRDMNE